MATNLDIMIQRINDKVKRFDLKKSEARQNLFRIALALENQTKINVRRRALVDTGNLLNSIRSFVFFESGDMARIVYGSFGVDYAAVHEFGFNGVVNIPAHSRRTPSGGTASVKAHTRFTHIQARPYIRPALIQQRRRILRILAEE